MITHDVWVEVDTASLKHNLSQVSGLLNQDVKIMAVVKANGFGHGYVEPARAFVAAGADALGVTRIDEAIPLRQSGIDVPILLFAPIQPENVTDAVEARLDMTVTSVELVRAISRAAEEVGGMAVVHVKVDTGMGRLGIPAAEAAAFYEAIRSVPRVHIGGIYTHFADAGSEDMAPTLRQLEVFQSVLRDLDSRKLSYGIAHAANSAALLRLPQSHFSMVRPGTVLYGQYPSPHVPRSLELKPTWKLKSRVCDVRDLPSGSPVGYGAEYTTKRPSRTAVVPLGYAEGYTLVPEGPVYRQSVLRFAVKRAKRTLTVEVRGRKAPVIGRVAMQMVVIDVTAVPGVAVGDEVVIPSMRIPTSALVPRVYV